MCNKYTPGKFQAMAEGKCPRCQSGKMFTHNALSAKFTEMNEHCPVCGLRFEIEPGFFWGAMYVSYGLTTALMIILGAATYFFGNNPDSWVYFTVILAPVIFGVTFLYRYSRVLMIYFFSPIRFEEKYANK